MEMGTYGKLSVGNFEVDVDLIITKFVFDKTQVEFGKDNDRPILGTVFLSPSARTRMVFESAALSLGMRVVSSLQIRDGEPLSDFGYLMSCICDVCVVRLPDDCYFEQFLPKNTNCRFINGGDKFNHPTQAIVDVVTLETCFDSTSLEIGLFGSEQNRAIKSFRSLASKVHYVEWADLKNLEKYDLLYCASNYCSGVLPIGIPESVKIMHPFPRGGMVPDCYDFTSQDLYHEQMKNSKNVRREILCAALPE